MRRLAFRAGVLLLLAGAPLARITATGTAPLAIAVGGALVAIAGTWPRREAERDPDGGALGLAGIGMGLFFAGVVIASFRPGAAIDREILVAKGSELLALAGAFAGAVVGFRRDAALRGFLAFALPLIAVVLLADALRGFVLHGESRLSGVLGNPNFLAALANAAALLVLPRVAARSKAIAGAILVAAFSVALAAGSKGGLLALAIVVFVWVVPSFRRRGRATLGAIVALVAAGAVLAFVPNPLARRLSGETQDHSYSRPFLFRAALATAIEHPLGVGLGMNESWFLLHAFDPSDPKLLYRREEIGLVHDVELGAFVEAGVVGGAGVVLFFLALFLAERRARGREAAGTIRDPERHGAFLAALAIVLHAQVDGLVQNPTVLAALVLLVALHRALAIDAKPGAIARTAAIGASLVALLLAATSVAAGRAVHAGFSRLPATEAKALDAAEAEFRRALACLPGDPSALRGLYECARLRFAAAPLRERLVACEARALERVAANDRDPAAWDALIEARVQTVRTIGQLDPSAAKADGRVGLGPLLDAYRELLVRDPLDVASRYRFGYTHEILGNAKEAESQYREVLRLAPEFATAETALGRLAEKAGDKAAAIERYRASLRAFDAAAETLALGRYGPMLALRDAVATFDRPVVEERLRALGG